MPPQPIPAGVLADADTTSLATLDVSRPERFQAETHWPYFARLRRDDPVHFCPDSPYGPYWSITRYDDIVSIEANHRQFSSDGNVIIGDVRPEFETTRAFVTSDPPVHTRERRAVAPAVSSGRVARLEDQTRAQIAALLDRLPRQEPFNWVERVSNELTTEMIASLFDFPREKPVPSPRAGRNGTRSSVTTGRRCSRCGASGHGSRRAATSSPPWPVTRTPLR